jgi:SAM-dependent methyltransferase
MHDWLQQMPPEARVVDLGSAAHGSFASEDMRCSVIAVDEDAGAFLGATADSRGMPLRLVGRCENLPLATKSIDLIVCNHALEHFSELDHALAEIGRVLKTTGRLYVSVPDGYGICDRVYRWVFEGGGHVNRFRRNELVQRIESRCSVRLIRWQRLYSSFGYLRGIPDLAAQGAEDLQPRLRRIGRLPRKVVHFSQAVLYTGTRIVDRYLQTSTALYGWALWFDSSKEAAQETPGYVNVCSHCGTGHPPDPVRKHLRPWTCLSCSKQNRCWFR